MPNNLLSRVSANICVYNKHIMYFTVSSTLQPEAPRRLDISGNMAKLAIFWGFKAVKFFDSRNTFGGNRLRSRQKAIAAAQ